MCGFGGGKGGFSSFSSFSFLFSLAGWEEAVEWRVWWEEAWLFWRQWLRGEDGAADVEGSGSELEGPSGSWLMGEEGASRSWLSAWLTVDGCLLCRWRRC